MKRLPCLLNPSDKDKILQYYPQLQIEIIKGQCLLHNSCLSDVPS